MFINFWYAAEFSDALKNKPMRVTMLGHDFVLFRDARGNAHCLSDTCIHRGASLSGGKIAKDCIQCPYHGWRFDGEGLCRSIPSLGPGHKVPTRARVDAYPVQEKYGVVFVFLGDLPEDQRPPLMEIPEWGDPAWRSTAMDYRWNANYQRIIENGLDPAHNEFVHPTHGTSGEDPNHRVGDLDTKSGEWGWRFMHTYQGTSKKSFLTLLNEKKKTPPQAGTGHHGPNQMVTWIHINPTKWLHQYIYETPVDEFRTRGFLINMRNFVTSKFLNKAVTKRNLVVAEQDRVVVERLQPARTPRGAVKELLMPADKIVAQYRDRLSEWEAKGWRIDTERLHGALRSGDTAFAIPSPGRRDSRNWVLDPVPLLPAQEAAVREGAA